MFRQSTCSNSDPSHVRKKYEGKVFGMCGFFKIWSVQNKVKGEMDVVLNGKIGSRKENIFEETGKAAKDKKQKRRGKKDMCNCALS
jgi:hypothetical protein